MTKKAREVLEDARYALKRHTDDLQGVEFRISWLAILSLLRAVWHVLERVDAKSSPEMHRAFQTIKQRTQKPNPPILWDFIKPARDQMVKEFSLGVNRTRFKISNVPVPHAYELHVDVGNQRGAVAARMDGVRSVISNGPYAGQSEKQVAVEAYRWLKSMLDEVDRLAKEGASA